MSVGRIHCPVPSEHRPAMKELKGERTNNPLVMVSGVQVSASKPRLTRKASLVEELDSSESGHDKLPGVFCKHPSMKKSKAGSILRKLSEEILEVTDQET